MRLETSADSAKLLTLDTASAPLVVMRAGETAAHRNVKYHSAVWAWCRGFRCVATEVVTLSGQLDAAGTGILSPTNAKSVMNGLPTRLRKRPYAVIIEAKATRADFLSDMKTIDRKFGHLSEELQLDLATCPAARDQGAGKFQRANAHREGNARYIAAPKGMIRHSELPSGWGLLEVDGDDVRVAVKAPFHLSGDGSIPHITQGIAEAWTRNVFLRPLREKFKSIRDERRQRRVKVKACKRP